MAPSNLQGLNVVHPPLHSSLSDSQDLLSAPPYPDLTAQLDLWTNLSFESDEPPVHHDGDNHLKRKKPSSQTDEDEEDDFLPREGVAAHDAHENVVTGTNVGPQHADNSTSSHIPQIPNFDLNHLLAGFGIDPFTAQVGGMPSLAQLLSVHSQQASTSFSSLPPTPTVTGPAQSQQEAPAPPPAKRARSRKTSVSTTETLETPAYSPTSFDDTEPNTTTPVTAAEDKRRRNTAASARFRMKKKEREAALEQKAKELESRVNELERECEGLRRENGWLKGLVVGVTGAQPASIGKKRSRDESDVGAPAH